MNEWFDKYIFIAAVGVKTSVKNALKKKASKDWVDFPRFFELLMAIHEWMVWGKKSKSFKSLSSISRVKESVRNASQKKNEFLRKLQEIEQISVSKKV